MAWNMATRQKQYTLYIDESQTSNNGGCPHFCMAGVIINDRDYSLVENQVNDLKRKIWSDNANPESIILHQKNIFDASRGRLDIQKYPEYGRFRSKTFRKSFYVDFSKVFDCQKISIVGGSMNVNYMERHYNIKKPTPHGTPDEFRNETNKYLITLQLMLENYCHFLAFNNAKGRIVYEYISEIDNERITSKFYQIKLMGSMYITKQAMEEHLLGINFVKKEKNNAGLQVADFVPNAFAREYAGFGQLDADTTLINKMKYFRYRGVDGNQDRYGVKYMP